MLVDTGVVTIPFSIGQTLEDSITLQEETSPAEVERFGANGSAGELHKAIFKLWRLSTVDNNTCSNVVLNIEASCSATCKIAKHAEGALRLQVGADPVHCPLD